MKSEIENQTDKLCLLALQGPRTPELLKTVFNEEPTLYKRYSVRAVTVNGNRFIVMKSGYTGEEGYEIIAEPEAAKSIWRMLLDAGVKPAGLGARDTLRLEMGYPLYGRDLTTDTTPLEAGLKWLISFEKGDFIGNEALLMQSAKGVDKKLVGFVLDRGIPRGGERLLNINDEEIGKATSGGFSPVLKQGIGMAYVKSEYANVGMGIKVEVRGKKLTGRVASRTFIKK